jgi:regulator of cell morphogenesis and NO signaling
MSTAIHPGRSIASVIDANPLAARVFTRHKIDFCCSGQRSIAEAAALVGVPLELLVEEIGTSPTAPLTATSELSTPDLIDHIVTRHHRPLDVELPRLDALADKVAQVHGGHVNLAVREHFVALCEDLVPHMQKEERVLFPWILAADRRARIPIGAMRDEHELVGEILRALRKLTSDYTPPASACNSWRALWGGLEALEADLHTHIHLENNILFPRVTTPG